MPKILDRTKETTPKLLKCRLMRGDSFSLDEGGIVFVPYHEGKEADAEVLCHLKRRRVNQEIVVDMTPSTIDRATEGQISFLIEMTPAQTAELSPGYYDADIQISYPLGDRIWRRTVLRFEIEVIADQSFN